MFLSKAFHITFEDWDMCETIGCHSHFLPTVENLSSNIIESFCEILSYYAKTIMFRLVYHRLRKLILSNWPQYFTYLSSSSTVGHKATTKLRHKVLSFAEAWASPQDSPISFSCSAINDCRHVIFGGPRFLFPGGVHLSATLGMLSWGIRRTCPRHRSRLRLISMTALLSSYRGPR